MKKNRKNYANKYNRLKDQLSDTMTIDELTQELQQAKYDLDIEIESKDIIGKRGTNAYKAHAEYITCSAGRVEQLRI